MDPKNPISGQLSHDEIVEYMRHRRRVGEVKCAVDNESPRFKRTNGKRQMMLKEVEDRIHGENLKLVQRILNAKTPEISLEVQRKHHNRHREKAHVMERNLRTQRVYRLKKISRENLQIRATLLNQRPVQTVAEWKRHEEETIRMRRNLSVFANREWKQEQKRKARLRREHEDSSSTMQSPVAAKCNRSNPHKQLGFSLSAIAQPPKANNIKPLAPTLTSLANSNFNANLKRTSDADAKHAYQDDDLSQVDSYHAERDPVATGKPERRRSSRFAPRHGSVTEQALDEESPLNVQNNSAEVLKSSHTVLQTQKSFLSRARTSMGGLESNSGNSSQRSSVSHDFAKLPMEVGTAEIDYVDSQLVRLMDTRVPRVSAPQRYATQSQDEQQVPKRSEGSDLVAVDGNEMYFKLAIATVKQETDKYDSIGEPIKGSNSYSKRKNNKATARLLSKGLDVLSKEIDDAIETVLPSRPVEETEMALHVESQLLALLREDYKRALSTFRGHALGKSEYMTVAEFVEALASLNVDATYEEAAATVTVAGHESEGKLNYEKYLNDLVSVKVQCAEDAVLRSRGKIVARKA